MEENGMRMTLKLAAIAASAFVCALFVSPTVSEQGGLSLSASKADARARVIIRRGYAVSPTYYTATGLPWYAVRAYYFGGPWSGGYYNYAGWADYQAKTGIVCVPGTAIKGGDGIMYMCQ